MAEHPATSATAAATPADPPAGLAGAILLAGGLKPTPLAAESGVHPLWMSPDGRASLLARWVERLGELRPAAADADPIELRVVFDTSRDAAQTPRPLGSARVVFVSESAQFRGPAGVARDIADTFITGGVALIAEANRWVGEPLTPMLLAHAARGADVTVARQADGAPAGVYLAGAEALALIPAKGFMDLKEQWLAKVMQAGLDVFVHTFMGAGVRAVRTRRDALAAGRASAHADQPGGAPWCVIADRAEVDGSAVVVESVVMPGARVEAGAIVARSVLPPGSVARAGSRHVDAVLAGDADLAARMTLEPEGAR